MIDPFANLEPLIRSVYAYVAYRIGDGPDAEDVTSETFERAFRYRQSFDPRRGEPIVWLVGIARRCVEDARRARRPAPADEVVEAASGDVENETLRRLELQSAISRLSPRERELVALRFGADLRVRHIAELLGERTNTIEVAIHRALGRLRAVLEQESPPAPEHQSREDPVRI